MATSSNGHGETQLFSDPFAADRSQRSELRAQAQAATQQTPPNVGGATLRNVVGAFMSASKSKSEPAKRPAKSRARTETLDDWQVSEGGKFAEIDQVLQTIRKDYPFVLESDFSPSTLALSLLSQTAPTLSHPPLPSFLQVHDALSTALQAAVQAHFQSFAASLPAHANFLAALRRAQQQVKSSKETLREAREGFGGKGKAELAGVRARERQVRDMLQILDTM
jgi:exocyst complex component 4